MDLSMLQDNFGVEKFDNYGIPVIGYDFHVIRICSSEIVSFLGCPSLLAIEDRAALSTCFALTRGNH